VDDRCIEIVRERVELIDPPIRILPREPRRDESWFEIDEIGAGVRQADDERRGLA